MRLSSWFAIVAIGFCLNAAGPVRAKDGITELQNQGLYAQSKSYQLAAAGASIGRNILVPGRPMLKVDSGACQERIKRWKHWFKICLKECEDIAAAYTVKSNNDARNSPVYKKELNECLNACNLKNDYYKNDLC